MAAKKAQASSDNNASDFIRAQSTSMTAPEVVTAGRKAGYDFSTSLVYAVRGRMKKGTSGTGAKREAPARRSAAQSAAAGNAQLENQVRGLVDQFVAQLSALVRRAALDAVRQALGERR